MTVTDRNYCPYDVRHASAKVSGEEPLLTPRGTRPIDARWIRMEWTHNYDEPWLEVSGIPMFDRRGRRGTRGASGDDPIVRRFRPSAYSDQPLPEWIIKFCQRHNPNPPEA